MQILRTKRVLSKFLKVPPSQIDCPVIGGSEGNSLLPIFGAKVKDVSNYLILLATVKV